MSVGCFGGPAMLFKLNAFEWVAKKMMMWTIDIMIVAIITKIQKHKKSAVYIAPVHDTVTGRFSSQ